MRILKTFLMVLTLALIAFSAAAAPAPAKKCPPKCHHRTGPCTANTSILDHLVTGFEINAGFRWQTESECPDPQSSTAPESESRVHDPFYIGAGLRLPLTPRAGAFFNFDRDFTDAPNWQARLGLSYAPFRK